MKKFFLILFPIFSLFFLGNSNNTFSNQSLNSFHSNSINQINSKNQNFNQIQREKELLASVLAAEACGEGYKGMYAVACVIQNRAKIKKTNYIKEVTRKKQFFGYTSKNRFKLYKKVKDIADKIVNLMYKGKLIDITNGATHFESINDFKKPYWAKNLKPVYKYKKHTFYKTKF